MIFKKLICKLRGHKYIKYSISSFYGMAKFPVCSRCKHGNDIYQEAKERADKIQRDMRGARVMTVLRRLEEDPAMQRNMTNEDRVNLGISERAQRNGDVELARYLRANLETKPSDLPPGELLDWNCMMDCQKAQLEQDNPMYADYLKQKANVK